MLGSPAFKDLAHNDALEAAGLIGLFLPTKSRQGGAESAGASPPPWKEWVADWVRLWAAVPNCKYWDTQWGGLVARAIKHVAPADVDWEPHLPFLFTKFLNAIEVRDCEKYIFPSCEKTTCGASTLYINRGCPWAAKSVY